MRNRVIAVSLMLSLFGLAGGISAAIADDASTSAGTVSPGRLAAGETFVDLLEAEDFAAAYDRCDARVKAAMSQSKLKSIWADLQTQYGKFQKRAGTRGEKVGGYEVVHVLAVFEKATLDLNMAYDSDGNIAGFHVAPVSNATDWKAPPYVNQGSFKETEVTVGSGEWALPGTLSMPGGKGPFPALVLVHGSGPHDRDETIGPNKPFKDLAGGLASRGVAVLRYEKRTQQYGAKVAGMMKGITIKEETIDDALAAVKLLETTPGIDPKRVFVLGHSLGGTVMPRVAALDPSVAGLVILAGAARPFEDIALEQIAYISSLPSTPEDQRKQLAKFAADLTGLKNIDPAKADSGQVIMGAPVAYWLDLRTLKPAEAARDLRQPMLVLQGERDYQATMTDFNMWKDAVGNKSNATLVSYPDLNHLFMTGTGKATPAEYEKPGHVAVAVVDQIAQWIGKTGAGVKE